MRDKLIESIRQILIKTVLPIRKKKEELLSNVRFSIAFRITLNYAKLFFLFGAIFLLCFSFLYLYEEQKQYQTLSKNLILEMQTEDMVDVNKFDAYKELGLEIKLKEKDTGKLVYSTTTFDMEKKKSLLKHIYYSTHNKEHILLMNRTYEFHMKEKVYELYLQFDMTKEYNELMRLLWKVSILYVMIALIIIHSGIKENVKVLKPIEDMSQTANRLNVNNLHSERLNVEGTKNELKDLAIVINTMLDRIETSYESQKQFVSDASHELRTPIAVIQGYANMLHRWGSKDEEVLKESIDAINNEAKSMQDLVEKLLFLSRHDKKTLKLEKKKFNMAPVVDDIVKETKLVAKNRIIQSPMLEHVTVYGDQQAIKQALRVFVDNAIKYTKDGDTISISCQNEDGDCVLTVTDTGIGMNKKDMDHIFQRFYRSDTVRNEKISGHGLGLSIAKLIILAHTGRIKIRSQFTKGTSFIVTIPKRNI